MIDYYSLAKIADGHREEAVKVAAQDRLASLAEAGRRKTRESAAARLRALAFAGARRLETATKQGEG